MAPSMSQITLDSNIKSNGSISKTILNENSYKSFTGLGRHTNSYEESEPVTNNKSLKQLQNFDSLYLGCKYMDSFREGSHDNLLWGHPSEAVHDKFARHLYSVLHNA
jgi:hypothetical protein